MVLKISEYKKALAEKDYTVKSLHRDLNHLNKLSDIVNNDEERQKYVIDLMDSTTNTFQEKILNISHHFDDSLKQGII